MRALTASCLHELNKLGKLNHVTGDKKDARASSPRQSEEASYATPSTPTRSHNEDDTSVSPSHHNQISHFMSKRFAANRTSAPPHFGPREYVSPKPFIELVSGRDFIVFEDVIRQINLEARTCPAMATFRAHNVDKKRYRAADIISDASMFADIRCDSSSSKNRRQNRSSRIYIGDKKRPFFRQPQIALFWCPILKDLLGA